LVYKYILSTVIRPTSLLVLEIAFDKLLFFEIAFDSFEISFDKFIPCKIRI